MTSETRAFIDAAGELASVGRRFYSRGWVMGTSGNFSSVLSRSPLRLAVTASSLHKGELTAEHILEVDQHGSAVEIGGGAMVPSAECLLHLAIVGARDAGAVLHTHSVWSTILSEQFAARGVLEIQGYEMLKGLAGNSTHDMLESIPILENEQDMDSLSRKLLQSLKAYPKAHAVLLKKHGLYTWGATPAEAERHVEILEFLFEVMGRTLTLRPQEREASTWRS
jgi:methylthioribulose-1-phosphate dehydratase